MGETSLSHPVAAVSVEGDDQGTLAPPEYEEGTCTRQMRVRPPDTSCWVLSPNGPAGLPPKTESAAGGGARAGGGRRCRTRKACRRRKTGCRCCSKVPGSRYPSGHPGRRPRRSRPGSRPRPLKPPGSREHMQAGPPVVAYSCDHHAIEMGRRLSARQPARRSGGAVRTRCPPAVLAGPAAALARSDVSIGAPPARRLPSRSASTATPFPVGSFAITCGYVLLRSRCLDRPLQFSSKRKVNTCIGKDGWRSVL